MKKRAVSAIALIFSMMIAISLMVPNTVYAGYTSCSKGVVYGNGTDGIKISINKAPYNTIFIDRSIQGKWVSVAYDYDGCGWFASARARELTGNKKIKKIWAYENWWNGYSEYGLNRIIVGEKKPVAKSVAVWGVSKAHPYGHVAIVENVNGDTFTISEGGYNPKGLNLKPYGYCILRKVSRTELETNNFWGYIDLGVKFKEIAPTKISIKSKISLNVNGTKTLKVTYKPSNTTKKGIKWASINSRVAKVDKNGKVKGLKAGKAIIIATSKSNKAAFDICVVTVKKKVLSTSVSINKESLTLNAGNTTTLTATLKPSNVTNKTIAWSSSDTKVVTVNSSGKVKAVGPGTATVTATAGDGNSKAACTVKVRLPNGVYRLKHVSTGKMMNYAWGWKEFEYKPIFLDKSDGSVEQTFRFRNIGNEKYEIDIMHSEGGVMNVWTSKTVAAGKKIGSWTKTNDDTQRFLITFIGHDKLILRSAQNSNLAVGSDGSTRGYLQLVKYNKSDKNQQWIFEKVQ